MTSIHTYILLHPRINPPPSPHSISTHKIALQSIQSNIHPRLARLPTYLLLSRSARVPWGGGLVCSGCGRRSCSSRRTNQSLLFPLPPNHLPSQGLLH